MNKLFAGIGDRPMGKNNWEKTLPSLGLLLKTLGTVFPNTERARPAYIYVASVSLVQLSSAHRYQHHLTASYRDVKRIKQEIT